MLSSIVERATRSTEALVVVKNAIRVLSSKQSPRFSLFLLLVSALEPSFVLLFVLIVSTLVVLGDDHLVRTESASAEPAPK